MVKNATNHGEKGRCGEKCDQYRDGDGGEFTRAGGGQMVKNATNHGEKGGRGEKCDQYRDGAVFSKITLKF